MGRRACTDPHCLYKGVLKSNISCALLGMKIQLYDTVEGELCIKMRDASYVVVCGGKRLLETKYWRRQVPLKRRYTLS
jgi:hypothetical protein